MGKVLSAIGGDASCAAEACTDAQEHLGMAAEIDARGDALAKDVARLIFQARRATSAERESLLRVASEKMAMLMDLDEVEQEHWQLFATERIVTARGLSLRTVELTERILTRRDAEAA